MSAPEVFQLQQPLTDGGIRSVNFFNGRLLTGKDLSREQLARRSADWRLGLASGSGVAFGLQVTYDRTASKAASGGQAAQPVVSIAAGLAINRLGQTLSLASDTRIALTRSFQATSTDCLFSNCSPLAGGTYVAGAGIYVLTIAPLAQTEGRAASNGTDPSNVRCNTDATVEAVQLRLLPIKRPAYAELDIGAANFRNTIVYKCFGAGVQPGWFADLLGAADRHDDLPDLLRPNVLSDEDVPLALLYITGAADLQFIDLWSVRRGPVARSESDPYASLAGDRRIVVGQAMFRQFQAHISELATPAGDLGSVTAQGSFRYLPPVGVIPVLEETFTTDAMATRFFTGMTYRGPAFINAARMESLLRDSWRYPPIDTQSGEMVWLYRVRENRRAGDLASGGGGPRSYVVFSSGHLPYQADAQFDLAYWNYSNYALAR